MCGDSNKPLAPSNRSVSVASRHGLMWLVEVPRLIHTCDATRILPQEHICPEHSLTAACANELLAERRSRQRRLDHRRSLEIGRLGGALKNADRCVGIPVRFPNQTKQCLGPVCEAPVTTPIALIRVSQKENTTSPGDTSRMFS